MQPPQQTQQAQPPAQPQQPTPTKQGSFWNLFGGSASSDNRPPLFPEGPPSPVPPPAHAHHQHLSTSQSASASPRTPAPPPSNMTNSRSYDSLVLLSQQGTPQQQSSNSLLSMLGADSQSANQAAELGNTFVLFTSRAY